MGILRAPKQAGRGGQAADRRGGLGRELAHASPLFSRVGAGQAHH